MHMHQVTVAKVAHRGHTKETTLMIHWKNKKNKKQKRESCSSVISSMVKLHPQVPLPAALPMRQWPHFHRPAANFASQAATLKLVYVGGEGSALMHCHCKAAVSVAGSHHQLYKQSLGSSLSEAALMFDTMALPYSNTAHERLHAVSSQLDC